MRLQLGTKTINGEITPGMEAPPLLMQLSEVLKQIKDTATINAFNPLFMGTISQEVSALVLNMSESGVKIPWRKALCALGTGLSGLLGPWVPGPYGALNVLLLENEK